MEDSDEFKWAVKVVIKRQMRDLMEQLRERGEEIAILTVNLDDNSCSHFGSPSGEWFVSEQKNLAQNFLKFCKVKDKKGSRNADTTPSSLAGFGSVSTPRSTSKQRTAQSAGAPTLTVTVPKQLAGDISEEELAALVGRIVASQLVVQEKGDGSSGGTKFDLLVEAANRSKKKDGASSVLSTPSTRSTRKRRITQKYREGMSTLKKGKKSEEEDTGSEYETGHDESAIINILAELSTPILKRVKVKTSEEVPVSIEKSVLTTSDNLEGLAVLLIQELDEMAGGLLTKEKLIQVTVYINEYSDLFDTIHVELNGAGKTDTEDPDWSFKSDLADNCFGDSDMEEVLPEHTVDTPKFVKTEAVKNEHAAPNKLKKRPKKKKAMSKITPYPCEHCGKTLIGRGNLVAHIKRIHYRQKDHKCSICPKAFNTSSALESHMLAVHTRRCEACQEYVIESVPWPEGVDMKTKRKVACVCGESVEIYCHFGRRKMYDDDDEDQINRRRYNDQTKYACQHCGKLFTTRSHCLRHTKMHTGVRDVRCQYCPETFRYEASLKKHLKSEHKIFQNYFCKVCTQKFATGSKLEKHYREAHGQDSTVAEEATDVSEAHKNTMVKVIAKKDIPAASPKVLAVPTESRANLQSFTEACQKEAAGHSQSGMTIASLQTLPGTSHKGPQTEVSMTTVNEQSLDKATYEIVQQALQGDQMFSGGNTIIIRTVHD